MVQFYNIIWALRGKRLKNTKVNSTILSIQQEK